MLFPTVDFVLFFLIVVPLALALRPFQQARLWFLIVASYAFYCFWDPRSALLLFLSTAINWIGGNLVVAQRSEPHRRRVVATVVALDLGILAVFKYCGFFVASANQALVSLGFGAPLPFLEIVLPVGISFFTFHGISYVVDLARGDVKRPAGFAEMLLYISFFPQLVAGPIVRAAHFLPQLGRPPDPGDIRLSIALLLIVGGLFKKIVVSDALATEVVDPVFLDPTRYGAADLLVAIYAYAVQIYCDFSAYTDIAIGIAALLGYRFPQNFDQPYRAASLREFWRRWHISLSSWLRDYLYKPLGGGRHARDRNLLIVMLLGGLWHGAAWTFIAWGALHGLALVIEHRVAGREASTGWARGLRIVLTFHLVCLAWIFFRAPDFSVAIDFLSGLGNLSTGVTVLGPWTAVLLVGALAAQFLPPDRMTRWDRIVARWPAWVQGALAALAIVLIERIGPTGIAPFIYFQF